jgi:chemotaxis protein MotB
MNLRFVIPFALLLAGGCVPRAKYQALENQVSAAQRDLSACQAELDRQQQLAEAARQSLAELRADLKPLIDRGVLEVTVDEGRIVIGMAADVLFPSGSADLSEDGRSTVIEVARALGRRTDREFQVEGHTDDVPIDTPAFPSNWHLGSARAINVLQVMVKHGMPADRISAATFGATRPVGPNEGPAGRARNRRIEVVLLPDLSELPGYEILMQDGRPPRRGKPAKNKPPRKK